MEINKANSIANTATVTDDSNKTVIKDARFAQNKYRNFYMMCVDIRNDTFSGKVSKNNIHLRMYADKHKCIRLPTWDFNDLIKLKAFTFEDACNLRDILSERQQDCAKQRILRQLKETQGELPFENEPQPQPQPQPAEELTEEVAIAFLKARGFKIQREVVRYEDV